MNLFCSQINNALKQNFIFVDIRFKKKYIYILNELVRLNLIKNFNYNKYYIKVYLRYYENKPMFFIKSVTTQGNKVYLNYNKVKGLYKNNGVDLDIFSSNIGLFSEKNILFLKNIGGLYSVKVKLLCNY